MGQCHETFALQVGGGDRTHVSCVKFVFRYQ